MALIDDLQGILGEAEIAKIKANPGLVTKLTKHDELYSYYTGEEPEPAAAAPAVAAPPAAAAPASGAPPSAFDLGSIERMLDKRLGKLDETIAAQVTKILETRGNEVVNNAAKLATQRADQLNRIYMRHRDLTGEPFDSVKFNEYLETHKDKNFRSLDEAYDSFIEPVATEKKIQTEVDKRTKAQSGANVPGTTPGPAVHTGNVLKIMQRGKPGEGAGTGAQRAAERLQRLEQSRSEAAS